MIEMVFPKSRQLPYAVISCLIAVLYATHAHAVIPFNIFQPYDVLIKPVRRPWNSFECMVGLETAFHTKGFVGDDDCGMSTIEQSSVNVLQLWQRSQDAIAAFKGFDPETEIGQQSQFLNIDDDNCAHGQFIPSGKLRMPANLLFAVQGRLPHNITLAAYLPYRVVELRDVVWRNCHNNWLFEDVISPNLLEMVERLGNMNLQQGWKRHGLGDLVVQAEYYFHRPQAKPYLKNVGIEMRVGMLLPTGLQENPDILLGLPFGYDSGVGITAAGRLELWFVHHMRLGIDVQLLHLFGNMKCRRIKVDQSQTDLMLLTKVPAFKEPGLVQHFTLFADAVHFWRGFSVQLAYQFTKQLESRLFVCREGLDAQIINDAESLQEWTVHDLVFSLKYDWNRDPEDCWSPSLQFFVKSGFNGKRAIVADTAGVVFKVAF